MSQTTKAVSIVTGVVLPANVMLIDEIKNQHIVNQALVDSNVAEYNTTIVSDDLDVNLLPEIFIVVG